MIEKGTFVRTLGEKKSTLKTNIRNYQECFCVDFFPLCYYSKIRSNLKRPCHVYSFCEPNLTLVCFVCFLNPPNVTLFLQYHNTNQNPLNLIKKQKYIKIYLYISKSIS